MCPPVTSKDSLESDFPTQCCQLGPGQSDPCLDLRQARQWPFSVGASQILALLVPQHAQGHCPWHSKTSSAPGEACCPPQSCCQHQWTLSRGSVRGCPASGAPVVPIRAWDG